MDQHHLVSEFAPALLLLLFNFQMVAWLSIQLSACLQPVYSVFQDV